MTLLPAAIVAGMIGVWFVSRRLGRGRPCPVLLAGLLDNRLADALLGTAAILERANITSGLRVLDAGCGPGRLAIPVARRVGASGEVVALDLQPGMLDRVRTRAARHQLTNVRTVLGALDAETAALRAERNAFDRVLLVTVLGELSDQVGALRCLHSALRPDGILSITETIIDPDYQPRSRVLRLTEPIGFKVDRSFGSPLAFTLNFRKSGSTRGTPGHTPG
jgi:ubiquinone/menaquinone biosynthesis C-methylase UbiE